jgi:hypothetical protein
MVRSMPLILIHKLARNRSWRHKQTETFSVWNASRGNEMTADEFTELWKEMI